MDNDTFSSTPTTGSFANFKDQDNAIRGTIEAFGAKQHRDLEEQGPRRRYPPRL
ncbi:hypothetical protein [Shinella kummerowiae]|uniref:hypothetical protein n=1 Tax=Shinella kummerowiae TaxID=417745 RepID=UPI0021B5BC9C|nr:hypothetical protein [Shinella kummerowiae]MCT7663871.1 hypothetical protein [Shinella kummerowiae]